MKQKDMKLRYEKEHKYLYEKNMTPVKDRMHKDNREWIRLYERKQGQTLMTDEDEKQLKIIYSDEDVDALKIKKQLNKLEFEKIYKKKIDEEFKYFDKKPNTNKRYKLQQIPSFTEINLKKRRLIDLKLGLEKHIKFHLDSNIGYIKDSVDSVEKELAHLFP